MTTLVKTSIVPDNYLDITNDVCPITFVRTKLRLEQIALGKTLEVRLSGAEALKNVPRSVTEIGHEIISCIPEANEGPGGTYRLLIRRR